MDSERDHIYGDSSRRRPDEPGPAGPFPQRDPAQLLPECDRLLQKAVSARLDAGEVPDASAIMDLVEEVRAQAGGACDRENPWSWMYVPPMDGGAGGCPGAPPTGVQESGSYVVNWGEHHFDGYGRSACWVRSAEGEWIGYLRE